MSKIVFFILLALWANTLTAGVAQKEKFPAASVGQKDNTLISAEGVETASKENISFVEEGKKDLLKPNIVFFLVDDLGWRDAGCMGSDYYKTPSIDRLAREGMLFTNAYSAHPVCGPSRASLLTGMMPIRVHNTNTTGDLAGEEFTLAEAFKEQGYATYFAGKWHLGMTNGKRPDDQGFDEVVGVNHAGQPGSYFYPYKDIGQDWIGRKRRVIPERDVLGLEDGEPGEFLTDRLTDETIDFIERHRAEPFFVYLSHYAVHTPLQGKPEYVAAYEKIASELDNPGVLKQDKNAYSRIRQSNPVYAANVQSMDESLGRIMDKLREQGLEGNTIIVFTSDNGGLSTMGGPNTQLATSTLPLRFGKGWVYEGGIRVPGMIKYPPKIPADVRSDLPVCSYDFFPTLLALAGLPLQPSKHLDGIDIFDSGEYQSLQTRNMYWYFPHKHGSGHKPSAALRSGNYKLIMDLQTQGVELYDLEKDISEKENLAGQKTLLAMKLKAQLVSFIKEQGYKTKVE